MPGKSQVRAAKKALYRELVLDAAERVFAGAGYDDAKIEEIARESGLSLGTVYSVFSGKAEVFRAVHELRDAELLRCGLEGTGGASDPLAALLAGIRGYTAYFVAHPDFLRLSLREGTTWGAEGAGLQSRERSEAWTRGVAMLSFALQRCIEAGLVHEGEPRLLARMMIAMQQVQLAHWLESGLAEPGDAVVERICADARRFFGRRGAGAEPTQGSA